MMAATLSTTNMHDKDVFAGVYKVTMHVDNDNNSECNSMTSALL